jgi:hypothetical protein
VRVDKFIVVRADRQLACRAPLNTWPVWQWEMIDPSKPPPDNLLTWETENGASRFASMNGGKQLTVLEHFYAPPS